MNAIFNETNYLITRSKVAIKKTVCVACNTPVETLNLPCAGNSIQFHFYRNWPSWLCTQKVAPPAVSLDFKAVWDEMKCQMWAWPYRPDNSDQPHWYRAGGIAANPGWSQFTESAHKAFGKTNADAFEMSSSIKAATKKWEIMFKVMI